MVWTLLDHLLSIAFHTAGTVFYAVSLWRLVRADKQQH
jgi:hypothetical protein